MKVNTKQFSYSAAQRSFTTEISDLGRGFNFEQVYDDSADTGLTLVSHETGNEIVFVISHVEFDGEGDRKWWDLVVANARHLRPSQRTSEQRMSDLKIRIFND